MTPEEMAARLDGMVEVFPPLASKAVRKTAFDIQATAKTLAPFDTGNLRNSITVENLGPYGGLRALRRGGYWPSYHRAP